MIKLPGAAGHRERRYRGEQFQPGVDDFFTALRNEQLDAFLLEHPDFHNKAEVVRGAGRRHPRWAADRAAATRLSAIRRRSKETAWQSSFTSSS